MVAAVHVHRTACKTKNQNEKIKQKSSTISFLLFCVSKEHLEDF